MSDSDQKAPTPGKREFRKKEHRPWNNSLLETTVQATESTATTTIDYDLNLEPLYADFNLNDGGVLDISEITESLKSEINQTQQQKLQIQSKLHDRETNPILLGGFFQPQKLSATPDTPGGKKIHALLTDLKSKEEHLNNLTRELEMSEAKERIEQAELTRKAEAHSRLAAENRMRQAIEQAQMVTKQFRLAMEQTNQTAAAHQEEERLRLIAEESAKDAQLRANNAELAMQNERLARLDAEEKMHAALAKAENTNLLQQQLQQTKELLQKAELAKTQEENRRLDSEQQCATLNQKITKLESELQLLVHKTREQEHTAQDQHRQIFDLQRHNADLEKELQTKYHSLQQKLTDITAQRDKLKEIILSEQQLRRVTEQKLQEADRQRQLTEQDAKRTIEQTMLEAQQLVAKADKARQEAERQRVLTEQRAKRAIEHASRTVMHVLNTPMPDSDELDSPEPSSKKPKITVSANTGAPVEPAYTEDDFKF